MSYKRQHSSREIAYLEVKRRRFERTFSNLDVRSKSKGCSPKLLSYNNTNIQKSRQSRSTSNNQTYHGLQGRLSSNSDHYSGLDNEHSQNSTKSNPSSVNDHLSLFENCNDRHRVQGGESNVLFYKDEKRQNNKRKKKTNDFEDSQKRPKFDTKYLQNQRETKAYNLERIEEFIHNIKDEHPLKKLEYLVSNIKEFKMYLQKEQPLNIQLVIPILSSAMNSNGSESDKQLIRNVLTLTKFFDRREIITSLTALNVNFSRKNQLSEEESLFISSILSLSSDFCHGYRHSNTSFLGIPEIPKAYSREILQNEPKNLKQISQLQILPKNLLHMQLGSDINIHYPQKPFQNDADYLHTMFSLFWEDFFKPLHRGIQNYMAYVRSNQTSHFRDEDVRVYSNVRLGAQRYLIGCGSIQDVHLSMSALKSLGKEILKHGNLVCFTNNKFAFIHFAMVAHRELDLIRQGTISVQMLSDGEITQNNLVMIEPRGFYTAYVHTLEAIRNIAGDIYESHSRLPFSDQLVYCDKSIKEPRYIRNTFGRSKCASFWCLLKSNDKVYESKKIQNTQNDSRGKQYDAVNLLEINAWPTKEKLELDSSQYNALQLALTKKLAIVQGPPGTGKTVIGLKIVNFLLSNLHLFNTHRPIVLVSYTNHALDQFLNGVFDFLGAKNIKPRDIIRVGSRSDDENLQPFNLKERLKQLKKGCKALALRSQLNTIIRDIEKENKEISKFDEGIIKEDYLYHRRVITSSQYSSMVNSTRGRKWIFGSAIVGWLCFDEMVNDDKHGLGSTKSESRNHDNGDGDSMDLSNNEIKDEDRLPIPFCSLSEVTRCQIMQHVVNEKKTNSVMEGENAMHFQDVWKLSLPERWRLYSYWISILKSPHVHKIKELQGKFDDIHSKYQEAMEIETVKILNRAKIVAFTTTGAAKYNKILRTVAPSVIIVEEAAHMPEQHILGCLSPSTEHLILIGDHQQLKPQADYKLSTLHPLLGCSMLERMVTSRVQFQCLSHQHRMAPELSNFVYPKFYEGIKNHKNVYRIGNVKGVLKSLLFLDHSELEFQSKFSYSYSNNHEAQLLTSLYMYLRQQGYSYKDITILSLYKDQVRLIRKLVRKIEKEESILIVRHDEETERCSSQTISAEKIHRGVKVVAVDNFQGEENKIILLSLVRSNREGKIGFVKSQNRMCVALTRAKQGMFVVGNLLNIRRDRKWNAILKDAEKHGKIDNVIRLRCQNHPDVITCVQKAADFDLVPNGGCNKDCDFKLPCGHTCDRKCHFQNILHNMQCRKPCERILCPLGHRCKKECFISCGDCWEKVTKIIPRCGHRNKLFCFEDPDFAVCKEKCETILPCGHLCQRTCGQTCNNKDNCQELVKVSIACGHVVRTACSRRRLVICTYPCNKDLPCGHKCKGTCGGCRNDRLHMPCNEKCSHILKSFNVRNEQTFDKPFNSIYKQIENFFKKNKK